jgi:mono/diheme cytochrome c family protein
MGMPRNILATIAVAILLVLGVGFALAGSGMMGGGWMGHGMMRGAGPSTRHFAYMHDGLPAAYRGKTDPLAPDAAVLARGRRLYAANCALCHGAGGRGDGAAGANLNPSPPDLTWTMRMPMAQDDFLYWTIAEGGAQFGSAMPAYKSALKPDEIWSIVSALHSGSLQAGR